MEANHIMTFEGVEYDIPRTEISRFEEFVKLMIYRNESQDHIEFSDAFGKYIKSRIDKAQIYDIIKSINNNYVIIVYIGGIFFTSKPASKVKIKETFNLTEEQFNQFI